MSAAAGPLAKLSAVAGPVAIGFAAVAAAATGAVVGVKMFGDMVKSQAEKLEGYSGDVSRAVAENEFRREMATFRRANRIGPEVARFESLRGRFEERLTDINTELLDVLMEFVQRYEDDVIAILDTMRDLAPAMKGSLSLVLGLLEKQSGLAGFLLTHMAEVRAILAKWFRWEQEQAEDDKPDDWLIDEFFQILPERLERDRRQPANNAGRQAFLDPRAADPRLARANAANVAGGGP